MLFCINFQVMAPSHYPTIGEDYVKGITRETASSSPQQKVRTKRRRMPTSTDTQTWMTGESRRYRRARRSVPVEQNSTQVA